MESHGLEPVTASSLGVVIQQLSCKSLSLGAGQQRHCRPGVNLIKLYTCKLRVLPLF